MSTRISPVTRVVAVGIGAALTFVLGRFLAIPSPIPNSAIDFRFALLAVFAVLYGPVVGMLAGLIGHVLVDITGYGVWPSWETASAVFGLVVGLVMLHNHVREGEFSPRTTVRFVLAVLLANALSWLIWAPVGDVLFMGEPASKVFTQAGFTFVVNTVTAAILGGIILRIYARSRTRTGSLTLEK
ncbi:ECF-type riboflavin transporter substrate-binding protein [Brachybacterium subflavum]|uniref:ECF-type riboflavin transporter substrate-binding protein n=1 Tax=Brachybacterium subflavum TaxID=2585206 RepID=UPI001266423B|nr:ECF-type riboflavin transporter substrate-binding protein [Brachybacterium subflavum]